MGYYNRKVLCSQYIWAFGLRPCPIDKAFPGRHENDCIFKDEPVADNHKDSKMKSIKQKWAGAKIGIRQVPEERDKPEMIPSDSKPAGTVSKVEFKSEAAKFTKIVEEAMTLESEDNMAFLWQYFALLLDRIFLYLHVLGTMVNLCYFLTQF